MISNANANEDISTDVLICPLLMKHFVFPLANKKDPTLSVTIQNQPVQMLLDTGAHVSVLPQTLVEKFVDVINEQRKGRLVRAFGGHDIMLSGPVCLSMYICGVALTHSFYYVNADVPPIGGYDVMRRAKLIVDTDSSEVWSKLSTVSNKVHWPDLKYVSTQPSFLTETEHVHPIVAHEQHLFNDATSDNFITNCANTGTVSCSTVSEAVLTSHANKGISSSQHSHSRVVHGITSLS